MISLKLTQLKFYLLKTHHIQVEQVVKAVDELGQQGSKSTYSDPLTVIGRTHCGKPAAAACGGRMGRPDRRTDRQTDARQLHKPCSTYSANNLQTRTVASESRI